MQDEQKVVKIDGQPVHQNAQDLDLIMDLVKADGGEGICIHCGAQADGYVEPDAEKYKCEACGQMAVYGAEQLLMYLAA